MYLTFCRLQHYMFIVCHRLIHLKEGPGPRKVAILSDQDIHISPVPQRLDLTGQLALKTEWTVPVVEILRYNGIQWRIEFVIVGLRTD